VLSPYGEDGVFGWSEMMQRAEVTLFREPKADDILIPNFIEIFPPQPP
jgi:hypothetical protein